VAWIDSPTGDLESTVFGPISATDTDNKVFIVKDATGAAWKKVRVLQNGDGYTLQHADIAATSFESTEIKKDDAFNFVFFDFSEGNVQVEPQKDKWDIMYSTFTEIADFTGLPKIPYSFKDYIIINRNNTKVGMVMITDKVTYENFSLASIEGVTFNNEINALGALWRMGGGPGTPPSLFTDRFFVIEDAEGNVFKLKFNRLYSLEQERGKPEFTFELLR